MQLYLHIFRFNYIIHLIIFLYLIRLKIIKKELMDIYSLKEVHEYIKQVIALNFEESIWIDAEISQLKEVRGQVYIEFIDKSEEFEQITAKAQGVIWYKSLLFIKKKIGGLAESILQEGRQIRFRAKIEFHEIYGLKLSIEDIDPSFTLGMVEINRQKIIARLKKEDLLYQNTNTNLPLIIKNIAVISSEKAAGLQDFFEHLNNNSYGYVFNSTLFDSSMQGKNVERDIVSSLVRIKESISSFDCVVIIRGGGSKMDLSYFDNYNISANVAKFPIPVLTGIGHDIDQNIIEMVAHSPLKTPTAVADFIVDNNLKFEMQVNDLDFIIGKKVNNIVANNFVKLEHINNRIKSLATLNITNSNSVVDRLLKDIEYKSMNLLKHENNKIDLISNILLFSDPVNLMKKGYSITTINGKIVKSIKNIAKDDIVKTILEDGEFESTVN